MTGGGTDPVLEGARRPFVGIDARLLGSDLVRSFSALQRSVVLALYELANWAEGPWLWRGRRIGTVGRGELTHALRTIAERARVTKDVADGVVRALLRTGYLVEVLGAPNEPTTGPTPGATPEPTYKPTTPRKLRLVHFLRNRPSDEEVPTSKPTQGATPEPTPDPTEIRRPEDPDSTRKPSPRRRRVGLGAAPDPRHRPLQVQLEAVFLEIRGASYGFQGGRDGKALTDLLRLSAGDANEVERRWRTSLDLRGWPGCSTFGQLAQKWNDLAAHVERPPLDRLRAAADAAEGDWARVLRFVADHYPARAERLREDLAQAEGIVRGDILEVRPVDQFAAQRFKDLHQPIVREAVRRSGARVREVRLLEPARAEETSAMEAIR